MRYLGIDYGTRRTGMAICDESESIVSPLKTIECDARRGDLLITRIAEIVTEYAVGGIVVGLPLNMDDTPGPQAQQSKRFAAQLAKAVRVPVHLQDERLSTSAAKEKLSQMANLTSRRKKAGKDMLAACDILQDYIDRRRRESAGPAAAPTERTQ